MVSQQARNRGPYDVQIGYSGTTQDFMVAREPETGHLLYKSGLLQELVDQQRTDTFSTEHRDPRLDLAATFENFTLGAGFVDAPANDALGFNGYSYTQGVDLSDGQRGYLSHGFQTAGSALSGSGARKFISSALGLFAINTRYIYKWSGAAWTQVFDDGASGNIKDILEFSNSTDVYLVAATSSGAYHYTTDGVAWTITEAASSSPAFRAAANATTAGATSLTCGEPAGAAENDILILTVQTNLAEGQTITATDASFWNLIGTFGIGTIGIGKVFWGRRIGTAPDYQMDFSASVAATVACAAYSGAALTGTPLDVTGAVTNDPGTQTFSATGAEQTWVVPTGVTSVTVDILGAAGSANGGRAQGTLATTPGETLYIYAGGAKSGTTGGFNGGANGADTGQGGGGASDIRQGGNALGDRVAVAGGGGGSSWGGGGYSGGTTGTAGSSGSASYTTAATGGSGGTPGAGGAAGAGGIGSWGNGSAGSAGVIGVGGAGGAKESTAGGSGGGGGGGGYYGGGGGGGGGTFEQEGGLYGDAGAGGGGGSTYTGGLTSITNTPNYNSGAGQVIISGYTSTSVTIESATTTGTNRMVVGVVTSEADFTSGAAPAGTTERIDVPSENSSVYLFEIAAATAAEYGDYTAVLGAAVSYSSVLFALLPVVAVGASGITRWAVRSQTSGAPVLWGIDSKGNIRNATLVTTPSNWTAADLIQIGQRAATQLGLEVINNVFYLVHKGGITSYDGTTVNTVFVSPFADPPSDASRTLMSVDNHMNLTFGEALIHFDPSTNTLEKLWPRGGQDGHPELNGTIVAMTSSEKYIYFAIKNSASEYYVMRLDPSVTATVDGVVIYPAHSVVYRGTNAITAMAYMKPGANTLSTTHPQLLITSGTTVGYFKLPKAGLRPTDDSGMLYDDTADRIAIGSFVNYRSQAFPKWLTRGDIEGKTTTTETIKLQYQVPDGTATALTTANTALTGRTTATLATPVSFTRLRYKGIFNASSSATTPTLDGFVMHAAPNAPRDAGYVLTVRLQDDQPTNHTNVKSRYKAATQKAYILAGVNQIVTFRDIHANSYTMKMLNAQTMLTRYDKDGEPEEWVEITLGQLTS
jgi:hypothetical protein